jgi:predicted PurR-regulated permease PerM
MTNVNPGTGWTVTFAVLLAGLVLAAADLLVSAVSVVLLILAGVLFGVFIGGMSHMVARHTPLSYRWSYVLVLVLLVAVVLAGGYYSGVRIAEQTSQLSGNLQTAAQQLTTQLEESGWAAEYLPRWSELQRMISRNTGVTGVMTAAHWLTWGLTGLVIVFFVGLYVAYDPHLYGTGMVKLVPLDRRARAREILRKLYSALGRWIVARLISMAIVGVLTALAMWILDVPLAMTLGVLAALLTFIPNIGPVLGAIPQVLLAFTVSPTTAGYVILFNFVLETVESYVITPVVQRYEVSLPPALTIFVQLLMGVLFGVIGIIMAAPLSVAVMLLVQTLYVHDQLGDPAPGQLAKQG